MAWPPTLEQLKADLKIPTTSDDPVLQQNLDAAVAFVEGVRSDLDFADEPEGPAPDSQVILGTVRLAGRWFTRRRSPEALVDMGELGSTRVPSFDPDIERLLRIGRYRGPVVA
ncbi:head-tail connector protein [Amycolatopsis sp. NPDC051903]|uniref:head-tail connector protein n=1 Tax=Amycolatopsis sp. NPDC051903 TaxID=3363936 RepID=UPI00378EFE87